MIPQFIKNQIKELKPRQALKEIERYLDLSEIITLLGMRQTGKTSLLYLTTDLLLKKRVPEKNIFYFNLEDPIILSAFNKNIKELEIYISRQGLNKNHKAYVFIDEIQYLDNPSNFLKFYYDTHPEYKFIISGSSTFQIKKKFKDSLAGRKKIIEVYPLSFEEFLSFKNFNFEKNNFISQTHLLESFQVDKITQEKINTFFKEYLIYGGHPKVALTEAQDIKISILKEIYNSYIRKDIKDFANIENITEFNNLLQITASQIGNLINIDELSSTLSLNRLTLKKYLFLLENTFVISFLKPYFKNKRKEISKMPKIYFEDLGIRNSILNDFREIDARENKGALVENFVFTNLKRKLKETQEIYFWRTISKNEIDFVVLDEKKEIIIVESKYKMFKKPIIPSSLRSFIKLYSPKIILIVTMDYFTKIDYGKTKIFFIPSYLI